LKILINITINYGAKMMMLKMQSSETISTSLIDR
jgi:hypothetical protein